MHKAAKAALWVGGIGVGGYLLYKATTSNGALTSLFSSTGGNKTPAQGGTSPSTIVQLGTTAIQTLPSLVPAIGNLFHSGNSTSSTTSPAPPTSTTAGENLGGGYSDGGNVETLETPDTQVGSGVLLPEFQDDSSGGTSLSDFGF